MGSSPSQHPHEESRRKRPSRKPEERYDASQDRAESWHVDARPIHQFLEHECVVALFDDLMGGIPEFRRPIRQHGNVLHEPRMSTCSNCKPTLAIFACPYCPMAICCSRVRERSRMRSQQFHLGKNPARAVAHDLEFLCLPIYFDIWSQYHLNSLKADQEPTRWTSLDSPSRPHRTDRRVHPRVPGHDRPTRHPRPGRASPHRRRLRRTTEVMCGPCTSRPRAASANTGHSAVGL